MKSTNRLIGWSCAMAAIFVIGLASVAEAVDGVVLISQYSALVGNVTPGDVGGFPVTISQPGSYRLEGNLTVPNVFVTAIRITANDVTLDLNGFSILTASSVCLGAAGKGCSAEGDGVDASDSDNVAVFNGTVRGMGRFGVRVGNNGRVDKVRVVNNGGVGILAAKGSIVTGNIAQGNGDNGIWIAPNSVVADNVAVSNLRNGIYASYANTVRGNTADLNGLDGIFADYGSTVIGNSASRNARYGLALAVYSYPRDTIGYVHNVLAYNSQGDVFGGTTLGQNLCSGHVC